MDKKLWYEQEARTWTEALPLGNGRIGAMAFSGTAYDKIQLNEETLWSGYPDKERRSHSMEEIKKIREMVRKGDYLRADQATCDSMLNARTDAYLSYGHIYVDAVNSWWLESSIEVTDYHRELDLETGTIYCSYNHGIQRVEKELFVSQADDVLVMRISSSMPMCLHVHQAVDLESAQTVENCRMKVTGRCPSYGGDQHDLENEKHGYDEEETVHFCSLLGAKTDGKFHCSPNNMVLRNATEVMLVFAIKTSFNDYDKKPVSQGREYENACRECLERAMGYTFDELRERHVEVYKSFFDRVFLRIDGEDYSHEPTDRRIGQAAAGREDNGLTTMLFDYARYLMISGSREGTQPLNLQGIWNDTTLPPWNCNYTMNINAQMNYWVAETCNLPECHMPLLHMVRELSEQGNVYGLRGWASWHNSDLWRFHHEATDRTSWGYWQMGGFWCVRHIWEHYLHTRDMEFLKEFYPVMEGGALFLEDWMYEDDNGCLTTSPSTSPENEYVLNGKNCAVCEGSAMELSIIYDLFDKTAKAAATLGRDGGHFEEICSRIKPVAVGKDGRILEWSMPVPEVELGHRHISHLYGFFPSDIWADGRYDEAVYRSLKMRMENGGGGTGWANAWVANVYARLKMGEQLAGCIRYMFEKSIYSNLMDAHPPFQIDGNFGICSAICEALMQSHTGVLELLPALPKAWKSGEVRGLIARTGEKISFCWKDGKAERL